VPGDPKSKPVEKLSLSAVPRVVFAQSQRRSTSSVFPERNGVMHFGDAVVEREIFTR
jgi:hypothetical protein